MSSFTAHHVRHLILNTFIDPRDEEVTVSKSQSPETEKLYDVLVNLKSPLDASSVKNSLVKLTEIEEQNAIGHDTEKNSLKRTLESRILIGLYSQALDLYLQEATDADSEADWWSNVERSWQNVAWYFLATLPERLLRTTRTLLQELRSRNIPIRPSTFTPQTFRQLFPRSLRPSSLTTAFFPHLVHQSHVLITSPLELIRQECRLRQKKLVEIRNERAEQLGKLLNMKNRLDSAIKSHSNLYGVTVDLCWVVVGDNTGSSPPTVVSALNALAFTQLPAQHATHGQLFSRLKKPSRLTLMWPRLALIPPLVLVSFRFLYGSRQTIIEIAGRAMETAKGFWFNYVVDPIKSILDTVRTGGDNAMRIVNAEGVRADLESLERMAVDLGREKLSYTPAQLEQLQEQIRRGDLTPVLRIYEDDIKSPLSSSIRGTLVRSILIQVQKAKVDLDQALSGIDRLLKSQELTFAFVGVAPSIVILYGVWSYFRTSWVGGRGKSKFGGRRRREATWSAIRRVERLLVTSPDNGTAETETDHGSLTQSSTVPPLTSGLLLVAVANLRTFAEKHLPSGSLLKEGFLEDVADLESPDFSRFEKLQVVARMWRSWGDVLGWRTLGKTTH